MTLDDRSIVNSGNGCILNTLQTMHNLQNNTVIITKSHSRAANSYMHSILLHPFTFYVPLIGYRIKNDSYLSRSTAIQYWHFSITQRFFTVSSHKLEGTEIYDLSVSSCCIIYTNIARTQYKTAIIM